MKLARSNRTLPNRTLANPGPRRNRRFRSTPRPRPSWRVGPLLLALALLAGAGGALLPAQGDADTAAAHGGVDVDVVVDFGDGRVEVAHLDAISGTTALQALQASGLDVVTHDAGFGLAVCAVGGVGCPAEDCFCACPGEDCRFWGVQIGDGAGGWVAAEVGASDYVLPEEGAVLGFVWGRPAPVAWTPERLSAMTAERWLRERVRGDGGLFATGFTVDAIFAARAVQSDLGAWRAEQTGWAPLSHLRLTGADYAAEGAAQAGKRLAGLAASDGATIDELAAARAALEAYVDPTTGRYGGSTWAQAWAVLGTAAAGELVAGGPLGVLEDGAATGGGWGDLLDAPEAGVDATGIALAALGAAGLREGATLSAALSWLDAARQPDGGWGTTAAGPSNVNSTALVLYALRALGADPGAAPWTDAGVGPVAYLLAQQDPAGFYLHAPEASEVLATLQAVPALMGRAPLTTGAAVARKRAVAAVMAARQPDGSFAAGLFGDTPTATIDALLALVAVGVDPTADLPEGHASVVTWLDEMGEPYAATGAEQAGRLVAAIAALGEDVRGGGAVGVDALSILSDVYDAASGRFGSGTTAEQAWGILGWAAAGEPVPEAAVGALVDLAREDGWGLDGAAALAFADKTALALEALVAAGRGPEDGDVRRAVAWLRAFQTEGGAFRGLFDQPSAETTGLALRALTAAGQHVDGPGWARDVGAGRWVTPREALVARQAKDGRWSSSLGEADEAATYLALSGLMARAPYTAPQRGTWQAWLPLLLRPR